MTMKVQRERFQDEQTPEEIIKDLQSQVDALTAENIILHEQLAHKEQFTAMIAHELRSPLSPIINYAQMIMRQEKAARGEEHTVAHSKAIERNTKIIIGQARRMSRLVNDLLDVTRLTSGRFTLLREPCDLVRLCQEVVEQLHPLAPYHTLKVEASEAKINGQWDSGRLQQALGNLIDNALKYSDEHSTITVRVWKTAGQAHVSVHNRGIRIPASDAGQIFQPYTRLAASRHRQGSGLGLYITRSIIEAHEGVLRLEMPEEGQAEPAGTTFVFDLPLEESLTPPIS